MLFPYEYYEDANGFLPNDHASHLFDSDGQRKYCCVFRTQWMVWRCVSALMGFFFFAAAFVQHNDPDPYLWVPAYTVPCFVSWAVAFGLTVKKYKELPMESSSSSSPSCSTSSTRVTTSKTTPSTNGGVTSSTGKSDKASIAGTEVVLFPRYGSANTKLNWLINVHVVYCFALGIWTLAVHLYGFQSSQYDLNHEEVIIFNHTLHMNASTEEAKELMGLCLIIAWLSLLRRNNYILLGKNGLFLGISLTVIPIIAWICVELFEDKDSLCN